MRRCVTNRRVYVCLLACTMILSLLATSIFAIAEGFDLSKLSNDEILELLDQVNNEVVKRGLNRTATLAKGAYIAGRDIPIGSYVYTCLATGSDWGNVTIYSEMGNGKQLMWHVVAAPEKDEAPETIFITLNEGDQLKSGVPFSLTAGSGIVFR